MNGVNKLVAEIAAASQEQSQSISQVSDTVQQLEKVTQQNAAMVEEATAAAGSLEEQASVLIQAVAGFKLNEQGPGTVRAVPAHSQADATRAMPDGAKVRVLPKRAEKSALPAPRMPKKRAVGGGAAQQDWEEF